MAKLQVAPELLAHSLFKDGAPGVRIIGASFDHERGMAVLEIEGPGVPDSDHINAVLSVERFSVYFEPAP